VFWKETAFPRWRAMDRRWKRNSVSLVSSVTTVMRLPISCVTSMAVSCHAPAVSIIIIIVVVVVDTGWLYVQSASVFRRLLDVGVRRAMADVINATVAVPMLELTVGVRDGGSPPRSTLVRLLVVAASDPDGEPVIISSTSSFHSLMWIQRLFIVVGSALGAAVLAAIVFTVVVSCVLFTHATRQGVDISLIGYSVCVCVCVCLWCRTKFRLFDKVETNWTSGQNFVRHYCRNQQHNIVAKNGNHVKATFDIVESIVQLVAFDNVAWTVQDRSVS